jgi:hypothetical protein
MAPTHDRSAHLSAANLELRRSYSSDISRVAEFETPKSVRWWFGFAASL